MKNKLLFVEPIIELVKLGIASSYVKNDDPVSILIAGRAEIGKSSIMLNFEECNGTRILSDMTKQKMDNIFQELLAQKKTINYILVPDFLKVINRSKSARANILTFLNSGIEEGIQELTVQGIRGQESQKLEKPIRFGMCTAITKETLGDERKGWHRIGFLSRFLPVSFEYTEEQAKQILEHIFSGQDLDIETMKVKLKRTEIRCDPSFPKQFLNYIESYSNAQGLYGFRMAGQIRGLLKASALLDYRTRVTQKDVSNLIPMMHWINLNYNTVPNQWKKKIK